MKKYYRGIILAGISLVSIGINLIESLNGGVSATLIGLASIFMISVIKNK
jgi:hypothetical protein